MSNRIPPFRPASTAIAAVLALTSTAAFSQEIVAPPTLPATEPAPALVVTPAAPTAPVPVITVPLEIVAPVPAETVAATPARLERRVAPVATRAPQPARRATIAEPMAAAPATVAASPAPSEAVTPADIRLAPVQAEAPAEAVAPTAAVSPTDGGRDIGELGLLGGALAIGGIAAAALLARRRRQPATEAFEMPVARSAPPPVPLAPRARPVGEAAVRYETQPTPFPVRRPAMTDTAAGRHMRAAEVGPSDSNPFLTRANRLRRARFLDAQEARAAAEQRDWNDGRVARTAAR